MKNRTNFKNTENSSSIALNTEFIKELLIPLSTFVENISDLEKIFHELSILLNMNHIALYKVDNDWTFENLCNFWRIDTNNIIKKNINLYISSTTWKVSTIPMPNFWDNIVVPVWIDNLFLAWWDSRSSRELARIENSMFELVAWVIANAFRSMKLIEQANTDKLTWLLNRNALDKYIFEWNNPFDRPLGNPIALCMLDIDHFKRFNDTFWHNVWDKVLRHVADITRNYFDWDNRVYRFGWEEITLIIHEFSWDNLFKYIDWVRKKISETPLIYEWIEYSVNVSIWIYEFRKEDYNVKDSKFFAFKYADKALYEAKEWWRNQVRIFDRRK